jgi:hypothetical protein
VIENLDADWPLPVFSCLKRLAHRAGNCGVTDVDKRVGDEASAAVVADGGQLLGV